MSRIGGNGFYVDIGALGKVNLHLHATAYLFAPEQHKHIGMLAWFSGGYKKTSAWAAAAQAGTYAAIDSGQPVPFHARATGRTDPSQSSSIRFSSDPRYMEEIKAGLRTVVILCASQCED